MNSRTRSALLLITAASLVAWPFGHTVAQNGGEDDLATSTAEQIAALASPPTVYTWSTTTSGFAWLNAAGVAARSRSETAAAQERPSWAGIVQAQVFSQ